MENKLYNKYFDDLINLYPSSNESINLPQYTHLNHLQENPSSKNIFLNKSSFLENI